VQKKIAAFNADAEVPLEVGIGVSAGEPLTDDNDDLFGAAVQLAARLCGQCEPGDVCVSLAVRELSIGKSFSFEDRGEVALKGLPEPTRVFVVAWRD
jgi:class 3 adenylate cyclase